MSFTTVIVALVAAVAAVLGFVLRRRRSHAAQHPHHTIGEHLDPYERRETTGDPWKDR